VLPTIRSERGRRFPQRRISGAYFVRPGPDNADPVSIESQIKNHRVNIERIVRTDVILLVIG
jgi:hypothetical protein